MYVDNAKALDSSMQNHRSTGSICTKERNRTVDLNTANNKQIYISEIPCQISSKVRAWNILEWNQDLRATTIRELRLLECC
jgi:hypothetical protein